MVGSVIFRLYCLWGKRKAEKDMIGYDTVSESVNFVI